LTSPNWSTLRRPVSREWTRVEAFLTAKSNILYAIVPRRPAKEIVLDDLQGDVRVTSLETHQTIDSHRSGKQVSIRVTDSLASEMPTRDSYRGALIQEKARKNQEWPFLT